MDNIDEMEDIACEQFRLMGFEDGYKAGEKDGRLEGFLMGEEKGRLVASQGGFCRGFAQALVKIYQDNPESFPSPRQHSRSKSLPPVEDSSKGFADLGGERQAGAGKSSRILHLLESIIELAEGHSKSNEPGDEQRVAKLDAKLKQVSYMLDVRSEDTSW